MPEQSRVESIVWLQTPTLTRVQTHTTIEQFTCKAYLCTQRYIEYCTCWYSRYILYIQVDSLVANTQSTYVQCGCKLIGQLHYQEPEDRGGVYEAKITSGIVPHVTLLALSDHITTALYILQIHQCIEKTTCPASPVRVHSSIEGLGIRLAWKGDCVINNAPRISVGDFHAIWGPKNGNDTQSRTRHLVSFIMYFMDVAEVRVHKNAAQTAIHVPQDIVVCRATTPTYMYAGCIRIRQNAFVEECICKSNVWCVMQIIHILVHTGKHNVPRIFLGAPRKKNTFCRHGCSTCLRYPGFKVTPH